MKKVIIYIVIILALVFIGCTRNYDTLMINYYDGEELIFQNEHNYDNFSLETYKVDKFEFLGWFLDKDLKEEFNEDKKDEYFKKKEINLYAKMKREQKPINITIEGKIGQNYVPNPLFRWDNLSKDPEFKVSIINLGSGQTVEEIQTTKLEYSCSKLLSEGNYKIVVLGLESESLKEQEFSTLPVSQYKAASIACPYMSNMVIQRGQETIISGEITPNQLVYLKFNGKTYNTISSSDGKYEFVLPALAESFTPQNLEISNGISNKLILNNILIGDVYFFAGQSNMQWQAKDSDYQEQDVTNAINANVRFFVQDVVESVEKLNECKNGKWYEFNNINYKNFSAIAFMTSSMLGSSLKDEVPIGLISAYQGNTNIANWMDEEYYHGNCQTKYLHYNAMVYPLRNVNIRGVIWYQGENNSAAGGQYKEELTALFANYRALFRNPTLPFYVVGLCCYDGDSGNNYGYQFVREAQAKACEEDENAYFISTCDDGDPTYIHPSVKRYIAERLSRSIRSTIYSKNYYACGPSYDHHEVNGREVIVYLKNAQGLYANGEIKGFMLAGSDGKYLNAEARIEGETIILSSSKVENPVYIKYAFSKSPFTNIFNKDRYSLVPFRTDNYDELIDQLEYNDITQYHFHPDGSSMNIRYTEGNNLFIEKTNDGKTYGSVQLDKWGMIAYDVTGFRLTIEGTNSNAKISFRIIEGSYEIWSYSVVDEFVGDRTFEFNLGELNVAYNKQDGILDLQKINYIEIMVEAPKEAAFTLKEARFIKLEEGKPLAFSIMNVEEKEEDVEISFSNSIFASSYSLEIKDAKENVVVFKDETNTLFKVSKSLFTKGEPYKIYISAINDKGSTPCLSNGYIFYLNDDKSVIINKFDYSNQSELEGYISSSMDIHASLKVELDNGGIKITTSNKGWQQFIFKLSTGQGQGMTKLKFKADFTNYKGKVVMQLADTSWSVYQYNLDYSATSSGEFVINFSDFLNNKTPFTTQNLMWVMFNFDDSLGGVILLDDVILAK